MPRCAAAVHHFYPLNILERTAVEGKRNGSTSDILYLSGHLVPAGGRV